MSSRAATAVRRSPEIPSVSPITSALRDFSHPWLDLNDKAVLVTGGTGSFGKHFLKTVIAQYKPKRLIVFSRDELKQSEMAQDFPAEKYPFIRYFIGDVRDKDRLEMALNGVDFVVHAAAMKRSLQPFRGHILLSRFGFRRGLVFLRRTRAGAIGNSSA